VTSGQESRGGAAVVLGSSRGEGNTRQVVDLVLGGRDAEVVDLGQLEIGLYDYGHANADDDFLPLVERLASKSLWILATPVYWYAMSGQMKVFFDRLSDLVTIRKPLGRRLAGRTVAVIASGTDSRLPAGFEAPFWQTCDYLGMRYAGALYVQFAADGRPARDYSRDVAQFQAEPRTAFRKAWRRIHRGRACQQAAAWAIRVATCRRAGLCRLAGKTAFTRSIGAPGRRRTQR
jgi:NAD(P)H-dependent FMN reductase